MTGYENIKPEYAARRVSCGIKADTDRKAFIK